VARGVRENRAGGDVVAGGGPDHRPQQDPQPHLGVKLRVPRDRAVAPDAALEVGATQRCGVGRRDTEQVFGALDGCVGEGNRRPEGVQVDHVERFAVHEHVGVLVVDRPVEAVVL